MVNRDTGSIAQESVGYWHLHSQLATDERAEAAVAVALTPESALHQNVELDGSNLSMALSFTESHDFSEVSVHGSDHGR